MKNSYIQFIINCVFICLATQVYGEVAEYPFRERVLRSDLIVEGIVEKQTENNRFWNREKLHSYRKKNIVRISNVYKGNIAQGDNITIFSHMDFVCDTSSKLADGRRYLLMLKKHKSGFEDVNYGRGMWEIVTNGSGEQVVVGDSWLKTNGESYEQFKNNIVWALSEPPSWPEKPAISYEQAKKIALEALSKANVNLKGFVYKEHKPPRLNIGNDIIGIAYRDDPMWYFRWEKSEVKDTRPMPPGTFISCYVHAHTGRVHPKFQRNSSAKAKLKGNKRIVPVVVHGQVKPEVIKAGEPIRLNISISNGFNESIYHNTFKLKPTVWNGETINISLVDIYRDDIPFNLYYARPNVDVPDKISGMGRQEIKTGETLVIKTDALKWKLRDGWLPGRYSITLRVDNLTADKYCKLSIFSEPVVFEIINSDLENYFEDKSLEPNKF